MKLIERQSTSSVEHSTDTHAALCEHCMSVYPKLTHHGNRILSLSEGGRKPSDTSKQRRELSPKGPMFEQKPVLRFSKLISDRTKFGRGSHESNGVRIELGPQQRGKDCLIALAGWNRTRATVVRAEQCCIEPSDWNRTHGRSWER